MSVIDLLAKAQSLPHAWQSVVVGRPAGVQMKVLRMDSSAYGEETHPFDEGLLVLDGYMNLIVRGERVTVTAGQLFVVPAGVPHAVAADSHGTLIIVDRPEVLP